MEDKPPPPMMMPPDTYPTQFAHEIHLQAEIYHRQTGKPVFNPLCLEPHTVFDLNLAFMAEHPIWLDWIQYYQDMERRPEYLR